MTHQTLTVFKEQQEQALSILKSLSDFLEQGEASGVDIPKTFEDKIETARKGLKDNKLEVALIGGFSEGKTSIAAAWIEKLDKKTMNINHQESSDAVKIYDVDDKLRLYDTPGLFGFKEKSNEGKGLEKYKEITKKYVSKAHLVLYVMNPVNPIKDSHKDDLSWLFRDLNLLPRTVFVLSRFDEVSDIENESDYQQDFKIKKENIENRLQDLINITEDEKNNLSIVAVAANPFDEGIEYWLNNLEEFKSLSHIELLQSATSQKIKDNGGILPIIYETQKTIIKEILLNQLPKAKEHSQEFNKQLTKLKETSEYLSQELNKTTEKLNNKKVGLRNFIAYYFADLIQSAKGTSIKTFETFYEESVGEDGIMIETELLKEFEKSMGEIGQSLSQVSIKLANETEDFKNYLDKAGKYGIDYFKANPLNNTTILAARDGIVSVGKFFGAELGSFLKFKPWGATKLAKGANGILAALGIFMELYDSHKKAENERKFEKIKNELVKNFNTQRKELIEKINSQNFLKELCPAIIKLEEQVDLINKDVKAGEEHLKALKDWEEKGLTIDAEFKRIS